MNGLFFSFNVQMYLDSSVSFLRLQCLNEVRWFLYRSLKFVANPTYVSVTDGSVVTVAWYTTLVCKHFPFSGQSGFFLQLHSFTRGWSDVSLLLDSAFLLWEFMMVFMLGIQE